jgi:hypothetical protein
MPIDDRVFARSMYSKRERHQTLNGNALGAIYDTNWSTIQNNPIFDSYRQGMGVGHVNFKIIFNNSSNAGREYNNGNWVLGKNGTGGTFGISVDGFGHITAVTVNAAGLNYEVGDKFTVISGGGIEGLVEIASVGAVGNITGLTIADAGKGYKSGTGIPLNDEFWSYAELVFNQEAVDPLTKNDDGKLKLDWTKLRNFAMFGSLNELVKVSMEDIIVTYPASLWLIPTNSSTGVNYELGNPMNIDVFTQNADIDDLKRFIPNYNKYEVVQTHWITCSNLCNDPTKYSRNVLSDCITDISSVLPEYRFVYIKKPDYHNKTIHSGAITAVKLTNPGNGYTSPPTVTITDNVDTSLNPSLIPGSGATVDAIISGDHVERFVITNFGSGYLSPLVTITGGGGTGATAIALYDRIDNEPYPNGFIGSINDPVYADPPGGYTMNTNLIIVTSEENMFLNEMNAYYPPEKLLDRLNIQTQLRPDSPVVATAYPCATCGTPPDDGVPGNGATATVTVDGGGLNFIEVINPGKDYVNPSIVIVDPTGSGATAMAKVNKQGSITEITITNPGQCYSKPTVEIYDANKVGATADAVLDDGITLIEVVNPGSNYSNPSVVISDPTGTGASATAYINGGIESAIVLTGGSGYTNPSISLVDPTGTGAILVPKLGDGIITGVTITNSGSGYSPSPTITITDPTGSGAILTPVVSRGLQDIIVGNGGDFYTNPTVTITDPTGVGATASAVLDCGVSNINIINPGNGYYTPTVEIQDATGNGAVATAVADRPITLIGVLTPGTNYRNPTVIIADQNGSDAEATAVLGGNGSITAMTITNPGSGYVNPSAALIDPTGTGGTVSVTADRGISNVIVTNGGDNYISPTVVVTDPTGSGATLTADIDDKITLIEVVTQGTGYSDNPVITITDASGTDAAAVAVIKREISGITITNPGGSYINPVINISDSEGIGATATAISNILSSVTVVTGGTGYINPILTLTDPTGSEATLTPTIVGGVITGITITNPGKNYTAPVLTINQESIDTITMVINNTGYSNPTVRIDDPTGVGATATAIIDGIMGSIGSITVILPGTGYLNPIIEITDPTGRGAQASAVVDGTGAITGINVDKGGRDYTAPVIAIHDNHIDTITLLTGGFDYLNPTVDITDPTGSGAIITPVITGGVITGLTIVNGGIDYTAPVVNIIENRIDFLTLLSGGSGYVNPVISFSDPTGTGATATVSQTGGVIDTLVLTNPGRNYTSPTINVGDSISSVTISSGGSGYISPVLNITDPTGTGALATATVDGVTGAFTNITIVNGGSNYINPQFVITDPTGTGAVVSVTQTGGVITSVNITNKGKNYTAPVITITDRINSITLLTGGSGYTLPIVVFTDATGSGSSATATATIDGVAGQIGSITLVIGGTLYSAPTVNIADGGPGSGALATAMVSGGVITAINITNKGNFYTSPTIVIGDRISSVTINTKGSSYSSTALCTIIDLAGYGSGANGIVNVSGGQVQSISVTSRGQNYVNPSITITDPMGSGTGATATAVIGSGATATAAVAIGAIQTLTLNGGGINYETPVITITEGGAGTIVPATASALIGSGALFNPTLTLGNINAVTISNRGTNYTVPSILIGDKLFSITVTNPGTGYTLPTVTITDPTGKQAIAIATADGTGAITSILVSNGGTNYTAPVITINDPTGTGATATATVAGTGGILTPVTGTGFFASLVIAGTGATATATTAGNGGTATATVGTGTVTAVTVTNPGYGYSAPTVVFSDPTGTGDTATATITGTGATATATVAFGIQSITLTNPGSGYRSPQVSITAATGSGATATATVNTGITSVIITNPGSGYVSPSISVTDATGTGAVLNIISGIININVVTPGTGYTNPTVVITDPSGFGATAVANIDTGISSITFTPGVGYTDPQVVITDSDGIGAVINVEINRFISSITLVNGGLGYYSPIVTISDSKGSGATATSIVDERISSITVINHGSGYTAPTVVIHDNNAGGVLNITGFNPLLVYGTAPTVTITGDGTGAEAIVILDPSGTIESINMTSSGNSYTTATVVITDGMMTDTTSVAVLAPFVQATATADLKCNIRDITITNPGSGYTNPTVTITDPTGSGATATATINTGLSGITVISGGNGYTNPQVLLTDSTGVGATFTVDVEYSIVSILINSPGKNYTTPVITITDPTGTGATASVSVDRSIKSVKVTKQGKGYTNPIVTISDSTGTGVSLKAFVGDGIKTVIITNPGKGYIKPQVTLIDPTGTGAELEVVMNKEGGIESIFVLKAGTEYTNPVIVIEETDFVNTASAIATTNSSIIDITLVSQGSSYINPIVYITDTCGNGHGAAAEAILGEGSAAGKIIGITLISGGEGYSACCPVTVQIKDEITCEAHIFAIDYIYQDSIGQPCNLIRTEVLVDGGAMYSEGSFNSPSISFHIKPKDEYVENFFNNLNDFQRILLDRESIPIFTSKFLVPIPNDMGAFDGTSSYKRYTWYTPDGWNLDISSGAFSDFIEEWNKISMYMDNEGSKTDTLYRMLVHESLKNLDWSFERIEDEAKASAYMFGETKVKKMFHIYGREYDEIKKYIHGVEIMNNLTYTELDNYPDSMLKLNVEYEGWKSLSVVNKNNIKETTGQLFYGTTKKYNSHDLETEFYRRLLLNSPHITRWKGTKHGVEMLMNLFGIERDKWSIKEYVYVATGSNFMGVAKNAMFSDYAFINAPIKDGYMYRVQSGVVTYNGEKYYPGQGFYGCPNGGSASGGTWYVDEVESIAYLNSKRYYTLEGEIFYHGEMADELSYQLDNEADDDLNDLCVERWFYGNYHTCPICGPFDPSTNSGGGVIRGVYSNSIICQHCHGTGQVRNHIGIPAFKGNTDIVYYQQNGGWYQDTQRNIGLANNFNDIRLMYQNLVQEGSVFYIKADEILYNSTHYWVLTDLDNWYKKEAWYPIKQSEMNGVTIRGVTTHENIFININLMKEIKDEVEGNNPHSGGALGYDEGLSYLQNIGYKIRDCKNTNRLCQYNPPHASVINCEGLFKYVLDNSPECIWKQPQYFNLENIGFDIKCQLDTKKSWGMYSNEDDIIHTDNSYNILSKFRDPQWCSKDPCDFTWLRGDNTRKVLYDSNSYKHYQIINVKNIGLEFNVADKVEEEELINTVLPYFEDLLPSTTIIELSY